MTSRDGYLVRCLLAAAIGVSVSVQPLRAQTERTITKLAEGVYAIQHRDGHDGTASGNTTVIIGDRQVFVVDACFLPSAAKEDIAQIRQWTDKPVTFVLNTHFHNDHNFGNRAYMDAFPAVTIIAHVQTKKDMDELAQDRSAARSGRRRSTSRWRHRARTATGRR